MMSTVRLSEILTGSAQTAEDITRYSTLIAACRYDNLDLIKELVDAGASVNPITDNFKVTPLYMATLKGHIDIVRYLVANKANLNQPSPEYGDNTPLYIAAQKGHLAIFRLLLEAGADVNLSPRNTAPIVNYIISISDQIPVFNDAVCMIELALQHGANANKIDKNGRNARECAIFDIFNDKFMNKKTREYRFSIIQKVLDKYEVKNSIITALKDQIEFITTEFPLSFDETKDVIKRMLLIDHTYWLNKIQNILNDICLKKEITKHDVQPLVDLLIERWSFIITCCPNQRYTIHLKNSLNLICVELTSFLEKVTGTNRIQLLMPTITSNESIITATNLSDPSIDLLSIIEGCNDTTFIEVIPCFEFARADGMLKYTTLFNDGTTKELNEEDKLRLINQSSESILLWEAICQKIDIETNGESFGSALSCLAKRLADGGVKAGKGATELIAGADANEAISQFNEWWNALNDAEKTWLSSLSSSYDNMRFGEIWERLRNPTNLSNQGVLYCVEILSAKIGNIIDKNKEILFGSHPHTSVVKAGSLIKCEALVEERLNKLRSAIQSLSYNVSYRYAHHDKHHANMAKSLFTRSDLHQFALPVLRDFFDSLSSSDLDEFILSNLNSTEYDKYRNLLRDAGIIKQQPVDHYQTTSLEFAISSMGSFTPIDCYRIFGRLPTFYPNRIDSLYIESDRTDMQETITALQRYGVTEQLINEHWQPSRPGGRWHGFCHRALVYLVTGKPCSPNLFLIRTLAAEHRLSPIDALREITGLCTDRISALEELYFYGVRGGHLRSLQGRGEPRSLDEHCFALEHLVKQEGVPIQDAINHVNELTSEEAWDIRRRPRPN